jgi:hypothetical protein
MKVYWGVLSNNNSVSDLCFEKPLTSNRDLLSKPLATKEPRNNFKMCPAFRDSVSNMYTLRFPFAYNLMFQNGGVSSTKLDQQFFDDIVDIRSIEDNMYSLRFGYFFIAEEPLEVHITGSYMCENEFTNKTIMFPGKFDIGKWIRPLECTFLVKKGVESISFNQGDAYSHVKFDTNENIELVRFEVTARLLDLVDKEMAAKRHKPNSFLHMNWYYNLLKKSKYKKAIMKEVHNNVLED